MDGRSRKFAYPHASVETALGFARESLEMDCDDVWVSDETGQTTADRFAIAEYAEGFESS
jgi:hypothetical protein